MMQPPIRLFPPLSHTYGNGCASRRSIDEEFWVERAGMASVYQKGCLLLATSLAQDSDAHEKLQRIYKLPSTFATLPASETVQALEMLGVISEEDPTGLIDLPFLLGMKNSYKTIKKKLKMNRKNPGFMGLSYTEALQSANLRTMAARVKCSCASLKGQVELLETVIQTQYGQEKILQNVIDALENARRLMDESLQSVVFEEKHTKQVSTALPVLKRSLDHDREVKPTRYVPKVAITMMEEPTRKERSNFDKFPSPATMPKTTNAIPVEKTRDQINESSQNVRKPRTKSLETDKVPVHTQGTAFGSKESRLLIEDRESYINFGIKIPGDATPPSSKMKRKGPPPPVMSKPKLKDRKGVNTSPANAKRPILPPMSQIPPTHEISGMSQIQQRESHRSSSGYTVMNPIAIADESLRKRQNHNYINVGRSTRKISTDEAPVEIVDTDSDYSYEEPFEEYEGLNANRY